MKRTENTYYGPYFWIAISSFLVPLFVAYSAFDKLTPTSKPSPQPDASGVDQHVWDYLLRRYVDNGLVDYEGFSRDYLFATYLRQLAGCDPSALASDDERLALYCNAYNALVIDGVIRHKIHRNEKNVLQYTPKTAAEEIQRLDDEIAALKRRPRSDQDRIAELTRRADKLRADSQFFRIREHILADETISLDALEQELIRPVFQEPRIHVALVCAARSCPAIRGEAYVGDRIDKQLEDQARQFANNPTYVRFDASNKTLYLSPILKWYAEDWEASGGYLKWLAERIDDAGLAESVRQVDAGEGVVKFNDYDWSLNAQSGSGAAAASHSGGFGSGSTPNE